MNLSQNIKVAVDAIVFGYTDNKLHVLLIKQKFGQLKNRWALVGGFVHNNETLTDAVNRELHEEAGVKVNYLEQLCTFGDDTKRDPRFHVISVAYFALVNSTKHVLKAGTDAELAQWFPIDQVPELAFDHADILALALERLRSKLTYRPIGFDLLPKEFLFSDLEHLYSTILQKDVDRRNFRKKFMSLDILVETNKIAKQKSGRPAKYFKFNKSKYKALEAKGFHFEI